MYQTWTPHNKTVVPFLPLKPKKSSEILRFKDPDPYLISTEPPFSDTYISKSKKDFNMRVFSSSSAWTLLPD